MKKPKPSPPLIPTPPISIVLPPTVYARVADLIAYKLTYHPEYVAPLRTDYLGSPVVMGFEHEIVMLLHPYFNSKGDSQT